MINEIEKILNEYLPQSLSVIDMTLNKLSLGIKKSRQDVRLNRVKTK